MTLIRVNPESVRGYGRDAQAAFEVMHRSLVELVDEVVAVRYFGPNAVAFKSESGRMAADFASAIWTSEQRPASYPALACQLRSSAGASSGTVRNIARWKSLIASLYRFCWNSISPVMNRARTPTTPRDFSAAC